MVKKNIGETEMSRVLIRILRHRASNIVTALSLASLAAIAFSQPLAAASSALSEKPIRLLTEEEVHKGKRNDAHHSSELSEAPAPLLSEADLPKPTPPIFERGEKFLAAGNLNPGIELPTGAIWQPSLWVFGDYRTSIGHFANGNTKSRQYWANRLDIFLNLKLTPTERILLGFSPLSDGGNHTGLLHTDAGGLEFNNALNPYITTLFFEGEFGEIFPKLDPDDTKNYDWGFSIGRQPILFQEGIMINDTIDAIGITRDTIVIPGLTPDMRATALAGLHNIRRNDNVLDHGAMLFGLFTETDLRKSTVNLDAAYVLSNDSDGGDGLYFGASATQRIGLFNTSFRVNTSTALNKRSSAVNDGVLLFSEISRTATGSDNIFYGNLFWGLGNYSSAARDKGTGGPLGRVGVLFAAPQVSLGGSALSNRADHAFGGSLGHQMFFNEDKTQLTLELGARKDTNGSDQGAAAIGGQLLHALNNRTSIQVDGFVAANENRRAGTGIRMELRTRF
ncbi:MAG: hypothetical protein ABJQ71_23075 [Roseibium sp.]